MAKQYWYEVIKFFEAEDSGDVILLPPDEARECMKLRAQGLPFYSKYHDRQFATKTIEDIRPTNYEYMPDMPALGAPGAVGGPADQLQAIGAARTSKAGATLYTPVKELMKFDVFNRQLKNAPGYRILYTDTNDPRSVWVSHNHVIRDGEKTLPHGLSELLPWEQKILDDKRPDWLKQIAEREEAERGAGVAA